MKPYAARIARGLLVALVFALCGGPQFAQAWTGPEENVPDAPSVVAQNTQPEQPPASSAEDSAPQGTENQGGSNSPKSAPPQAPAGAAGAQQGETAGGAASRPAGAAIAPAKQRQVRSLLIKLGAVAAAGAAVGAVYALTRGTSSVPPGAPAR